MDSPNQEFDLEIKDKKEVENLVVDHLSCMTNTNTQDPPINDFLRDDMLLKVTASHPWYANIVNFMVSVYIPPGESKKKLVQESRHHLWDWEVKLTSTLTSYIVMSDCRDDLEVLVC